MIEPVSWLTALGLGLYALIMVFKWWAGKNSTLAKTKQEIENEYKEARKNHDRGAILRVFGKLRDNKK